MDKVVVAQRVAKKLWETECKIDEAIRETTELMAEIMKVPVDMGVSFGVVDKSQAKVMEVMKTLSDARSVMMAAHAELTEAKLRVGLRKTMFFTPCLDLEEEVRMETSVELRKVG